MRSTLDRLWQETAATVLGHLARVACRRFNRYAAHRDGVPPAPAPLAPWTRGRACARAGRTLRDHNPHWGRGG